MPYVHQQLAAGRWYQLSLMEQLANIGSEVERAINWQAKGDDEYSRLAFERALELFDLTLVDSRHRKRLKELCRAREVVADYFVGGGTYGSSTESLKNYFYQFAYASRKDR